MNRLFEIVYILLHKKKVTAKELAERFEVSVRTIYRDLDALSIAGIPVYTNKGKNGGIALMEDFVLDRSLLSKEEQNEIMFALEGMKKLQENTENDLLLKLGDIFQKSNLEWINIDFSHWGNVGQEDKFKNIKKGILQTKVLQFQYYNTQGDKTERRVEPMQLYFKSKSWYLKAYCLTKQEFRMFKITRMKQVMVTEETFTRREMVVEKPNYTVKPVTIVLEIDQTLAFRVYDEFEEENIKQKENGNFEITVTYPEDGWVYGYLLSFGSGIKIISPNHVKEMVKETAKRMLENNV